MRAKVWNKLGFHWSRLFAWGAAVATALQIFLYNAFTQRIINPEPLSGMEWVEFPERFIRVGPYKAISGYIATAIVVMIGMWLAAAIGEIYRSLVSRKAEVSIDDGVLYIAYASFGKKRIPLSDVLSCEPREGKRLAVRLRSGAEYVLEVDDPLKLERSIEAHLDVETVPAGMAWQRIFGGTVYRWLWGFGGFTMLMPAMKLAADDMSAGAWQPAVIPMIAMLIWASVGLLGSAKQRVAVGSDGVRIERPWGKRFIHIDRIDSARIGGDALYITLKDGDEIRVGKDNSEELRRRIVNTLKIHRDKEATQLSDEHTHLLARGDRDRESWKAALGKLLETHDYRKESVRIADLEELVADVGAQPEQRVAAALALPKDDATRQRIRIAASRSVDLDMRAALEAAAEDELDERPLRRAQSHHRPG